MGGALIIPRDYLNDGHIYIIYILFKYINVKQKCFMARANKQKITAIKYHNERGIYRLIYHISALVSVFATLVVSGSTPTL